MSRASEKKAREKLASRDVVVHKKGGQHYDGYNDVEVYKHGPIARLTGRAPKKAK